MTRRAFLAALAAPALPVSPLDCVRRDPCAGDLLEGPNGATVQVDLVLPECNFILWTKTTMASESTSFCSLKTWRELPGWADARVVRLGVRG